MGFIPFLIFFQSFAQTPNLDKAYVSFEISHLGVLTIEGSFERMTGEFSRSQDGWLIQGEIDVTSINTDNSSRDETVLTEQYLNAIEFPTIPFQAEIKSSKIIINATIRGIPIRLKSQLILEDDEFISKPITINRKAIGLDFGAMDTLIGNEIRLVIHSGLAKVELKD